MAKRDITKTDSVELSGEDFPIVEFKGEPVLTFSMIDSMHQRPTGTARKRFNDNKERFIEGKHFYHIDSSQKSEFRTYGIAIPPRGIVALTERGYLLLAKSLTDDRAWEVQERLIDCYFRAKKEAQNPTALSDNTEKHYWVVMNTSGKILEQVELNGLKPLNKQIDRYFPAAMLLGRDDLAKKFEQAKSIAYGAAAELNMLFKPIEMLAQHNPGLSKAFQELSDSRFGSVS